MNKGILKNTKAGWFVLYQVMRDELTSGYDSIPLHPDSQTWMDGYNLYEGKEVEFEVRVYPSGSRFAKTIHEDDLGCSYPDCICQGNEITDCNNRTPKQRKTMSKVQTPDQVVLGYKTALVEGMNNLNRHTQQVDFSNPNADKISSGTTNKNTLLNNTTIKVMNNLDKQYTDLLQDILDNGSAKSDRTGTGTISVFGRQIRHKMSDGFPLLTTKKMAWKSIVTELLWFLRGDTSIEYLLENDCNIWTGDAYKRYSVTAGVSTQVETLTQEEFINKIKTDDKFAKKWGELGKIYGHGWRNWNGKSDDELYEDYLKKVK
jgi:hypothetical protein